MLRLKSTWCGAQAWTGGFWDARRIGALLPSIALYVLALPTHLAQRLALDRHLRHEIRGTRLQRRDDDVVCLRERLSKCNVGEAAAHC